MSSAIGTFALVLTWIWPLAGGPSPAVLPWLVSAACLSVWVLVALWRPLDVGRCTAMAWLVGALASSVIGLLQFFGASAQFKPWINVTALGDAFGNLRQRNQFASLTNIGLVVLLWGPLAGHWRGHGHAGHRHGTSGAGLAAPLAWGALALLAMANAASSSRTGLLQLLVLVVLAWFWRSDSRTGVALRLLAAIVVYAIAAIALPMLAGLDPFSSGIAGRFGDADRACGSRSLLWANVLHLVSLKPWSGWGWGELDLAHFMALYPGARFCDILDNAHNLPLHLAVELGVPIALLLCAAIGWLVWRARPWRELDDRRRMAWAVLALIGLHSMLEYPLWYGPFQIAAVLAIWILWSRPQATVVHVDGSTTGMRPERPLRPVPASVKPWTGTVAVLVLLALAYAAWDYHRVSQIYLAPDLRASAYREDTIRKVQASWLFRNQVRFATLTLASVTPDNAAQLNAMAHELLHFSPEARVVEKIIDSALVLGRTDEVATYLLRYRNAFPDEFKRWRARRIDGPTLEMKP